MRKHDDTEDLDATPTPKPASSNPVVDSAAAIPTSGRVKDILGTGNDKPSNERKGGPGDLEFGSPEHQKYGNDGAAQAGWNRGYHQPTRDEVAGKHGPGSFHFTLTHGDIVMLSGDYFDPRETDESGRPVPDNLFRLAALTSPNPGSTPAPRTRFCGRSGMPIPLISRFHGEGEFAFLVEPDRDKKAEERANRHLNDPGHGANPNNQGRNTDDRPAAKKSKFSDEVIESGNNRYLRLAAANFEHFANPNGPGSGGPKSGNRHSAGGSYRALHEDAIHRAHEAKKAGQPIDDAMAHEAASEHFLTDGFAAGHLRTPRGTIESYWGGMYPLFFENLKKTIAQDVANYMNANETNPTTVLGSVTDIMNTVLPQIDEKTKNLPPVGFEAMSPP